MLIGTISRSCQCCCSWRFGVVFKVCRVEGEACSITCCAVGHPEVGEEAILAAVRARSDQTPDIAKDGIGAGTESEGQDYLIPGTALVLSNFAYVRSSS